MTSVASAKEPVRIATLEWAPFISTQLPNNGYTAEVIKAAFEHTNYNINIEFVTLARGRKLLEQGLVDGYITPYNNIKEAEHHLLSLPFHGDSMGLLKPKSLSVPPLESLSNQFDDFLEKLANYRFGIIKGSIISPRFKALPASNVTLATNDLENIDNLMQGKVDFIVIGKYSAAEIITNQRPHLIGKFEFLQSRDSNKGFRIAFSGKNPNHLLLRDSFNNGLKEITQNGMLEKLNQKHGLYPSKRHTDNKTLTIGTVNNHDMLMLKTLTSAFEKAHTDIILEWRIYDENTLRRRTLSDLAISDGQFDIVTIGLQELPVWSKNKWLAPIKNLPDTYEVDDIFSHLIAAHSYKDELYALPFYAESSVTYYRKDLFAKAKLLMPKQPSYNDIMKFAKALHRPRDGTYGVCLRGKPGWGENMGLFTTMVNAYGGKWFDNKWQPQINTKPWQEALKNYTSLLTKYGPPKPTLNGYNENLQLFIHGKCGIWIDATIASSSIFDPELSHVSDIVGVVKAPIAKSKTGTNWLWAWSFAIPESSNNKQAAQQFITWATSHDYNNLVASEKGIKAIPQGTRRSTYDNKAYRASVPYSDVMFDAMLEASKQIEIDNDKPYKGIQFVEIDEFPAIANQVGLLVSEVIQGKIKPNNALKKAQNYTQLQMALSGYYEDNAQ
ncbi:extracellular solute-binding protein [Thalassotalea fusca]